MAVTLAAANVYFGDRNHSESAIWQAFAPKQQEAAIAEAIRWLQSQRMQPYYTVTGTDPSDQTNTLDTDTTTATDFPREDLATYEQALWFLKLGDAVPDGTKTGPKWFSDARTRLMDGGFVKDQTAPMAKHWMGWNYRGFNVARG